jgi:nucleoside-diphosphate-sugar epimerase
VTVRIAVTGGTGFIGSHVVELLLDRPGVEVRCLVLPGEAPLWLERKPVSLFKGDVTDRSTLGPFLSGCDAVANIAGLTRAWNEDSFMAVNARGAVNLAEAALAIPDGPRHIVSMSSLAAVGPCPEGRCADEADPLRPLTPYARSKAALESALRGYEGRLHTTFIRAPGVYGPRDHDFLQYFKLVKRGFRIIVGKRNVVSLLYVKTLARAIVSCLLNPAAFGQAFFIADDGEYDWDDFSAIIEKALSKRTLRVHLPDGIVALVALASEAVKPLMRRPPLLDKNKLIDIRQSRWVVSTAKARRLIGFEPIMPTEDAIAETACWYEEHGWI